MAVPGRKAPRCSSEESSEIVMLKCQPCCRDLAIVSASYFCLNCDEHLCKQCAIHHKKAKPSRSHILLEKDKMPLTQHISSESSETDISDDLTDPCPKHKKEYIRFYCRSHNTLICSACINLSHKFCKVDYIPDSSSHLLDSAEYNETIQKVDDILTKCEQLKFSSEENIEISNESLSNTLSRMDSFKDEIIEKINELQAKMQNLAESFHEEENQKMQNTIATCDAVSTRLSKLHDTMKELNRNGKAEKLYLTIRQSQCQVEEYESNIKQLQLMGEFKECLFIPNYKITSAIESEKSFGNLSQDSRSITNPDISVQSDMNAPLFFGKSCVSTSKDEDYCSITGMAFLKSNRIAVVDKDNNSVKIVDTKKKQVASELSFSSSPFDITTVGRNELAVTLPEEESIQFLSTSFLFSKKNSIYVDGECSGISCFQKKIVVSFATPAKLEILDLKGKVMTKVATDSNGEDIFSDPKYVTSNIDFIFVSDYKKDEVIKLNWKGELLGRFGDLDCPKGLIVFAKGEIFVCDGSYDNTIFKIADDFSNGQILMNSSKATQAIVSDANERKVYISFDEWDSSNNYINCYQLP